MESSVLAAVAYRRDRRQLYLRFHSGDVYRYFEFPPHQYDELLAAESKGRYFAHSIRDKFLYEQVCESPLYGTSYAPREPLFLTVGKGCIVAS